MLSACVLHILCDRRGVCGSCLRICIAERVSESVRLLISVHRLLAEMCSPSFAGALPRQQMSQANGNWWRICYDASSSKRSCWNQNENNEVMMTCRQVLTHHTESNKADPLNSTILSRQLQSYSLNSKRRKRHHLLCLRLQIIYLTKLIIRCQNIQSK